MQRARRSWRLLFISLWLFATWANIADGQVAVSSITGTVTDPQGHRVPGATVRAVERSTGLLRRTVATSVGTYSLDALPAGVYSVTFSKSGFADFVADRVEQTVGYRRTLDVRLALSKGKGEQVSIVEP